MSEKPLPHIYTPAFDPGRRPFESCVDQPDTAERPRLAVQSIPLWLPPKKAKGISP